MLARPARAAGVSQGYRAGIAKPSGDAAVLLQQRGCESLAADTALHAPTLTSISSPTPSPPSHAAGLHGAVAGCGACSTAGPPCADGRAPASALPWGRGAQEGMLLPGAPSAISATLPSLPVPSPQPAVSLPIAPLRPHNPPPGLPKPAFPVPPPSSPNLSLSVIPNPPVSPSQSQSPSALYCHPQRPPLSPVFPT